MRLIESKLHCRNGIREISANRCCTQPHWSCAIYMGLDGRVMSQSTAQIPAYIQQLFNSGKVLLLNVKAVEKMGRIEGFTKRALPQGGR